MHASFSGTFEYHVLNEVTDTTFIWTLISTTYPYPCSNRYTSYGWYFFRDDSDAVWKRCFLKLLGHLTLVYCHLLLEPEKKVKK